jgi:toxin-antitoxin system PIN domain toxin
MILVDTNLLLYASIGGTAQHERAKQWLDELFGRQSRIGLPWHSLLGFVRIASNARAHTRAASVEEAWLQVRGWLNARNVWIPQPTERHADVIEDIFTSTRTTSEDVMDAHLAALAIEHGLILCSADRNFARYPALRWFNPLAV